MLFVLALLTLGAGGWSAVAGLWTAGDPLWVLSLVAGGLVLSTFISGTVSGDYSWVDRLWSTAPIGFAWYYAWRAMAESAAWLPMGVAAALVTLWGARLTFNFARRGGYSHYEDYRWPILRARIKPKIFWHLFSLLFISAYQIGLFLLFTLPLYGLYLHSTAGQVASGLSLWLAALLGLAFLVYETLADQQRWDFHRVKAALRAGGDAAAVDVQAPRYARWVADVATGYPTAGLFRYSRRPNYFGELGFWWAIYGVGIAAAGLAVHWSLLGPVMLSLLFVGSTKFTDAITASRYPTYGVYMRQTSAIVPWWRKAAAASSPTAPARSQSQ